MNKLIRDNGRPALATIAMSLLCAAAPVVVQAETLDFGEIEVGKTYDYSRGDEISATYTAPEDGTYKVIYVGADVPGYTEAEHVNIIEHTFSWGADSERCWSIPMKAGQTVYFYSSSLQTLGDGSFKIAARPEALLLEKTSPSLEEGNPNYYGGKLSVSSTFRFTFYFSEPVAATSATLRYPDGTYSSVPMHIGGSNIEISLHEEMMNAYREGKLKNGDTMKIRIVGVKCADYEDIRYNGNGRIEVEMNVCGKPIELVSTTNSPTTGMPNMLSYYLPGDPNGILSMEFDGEVAASRKPTTTIAYGNPEDMANPRYFENPPTSIEEGKVIVDFTGRRRRPLDMIPGGDPSTLEKSLVVQVANIYSTDGQRAYVGETSSFTSFTYVYPIEVLQYTMATDFTPARNTRVTKDTKVEMWIMNGSKCSFDGITLGYEKDGVPASMLLSKDDIEIAADPDSADDLLVYFTIPELDADLDSELSVSLSNSVFGDGVDHTADTAGSYVWAGNVSVDNVAAGDISKGDVYNIAGVRVLTDASMRDVQRLPSGLYIFNNKKVIVTTVR